MRYRMVALDLDGTLLNSRKEITPRTQAALIAARARGIVAVIATGRTVHSALKWSQTAGGGPVVCCNGAAVFGPTGDLMTTRSIAKEPLIRALELCKQQGIMAECYTVQGLILDRPFEQIQGFWRWVRPGMTRRRAMRSLVQAWWINKIQPVRSLINWASGPRSSPVLKLMVIGPAQKLQSLVDQLRSQAPGLEISSSGHDNLEITGPGVTKASGLERLGAHLQIPRQAIVAIGDSANDLEMLKYAGLGVAMGNATEQVKSVADRVTAHCDQEGVAQAIEAILAQQDSLQP